MKFFIWVIIIVFACFNCSINAETITQKYKIVYYCEESNTYRVFNGNRWGFTDANYNEIVPCVYEWTTAFDKDGIALVQLEGRYGYLRTDGTYLFEPEFEAAYVFTEGKAVVSFESLWGYVLVNGQWLVEPCFEYAVSFNEGVACVKKDGYWGIIDSLGNQKTKFQYVDTGYYSYFDLIAATIDGELWGYIDKQGLWYIPPMYDYAGNFEFGIAVVAKKVLQDETEKEQMLYGLINPIGDVILDFDYDFIGENWDGMMTCKKDNKFQYFQYLDYKLVEIDEGEDINQF